MLSQLSICHTFLLYILRTSPCYAHPLLQSFDNLQIYLIRSLPNIRLVDRAGQQACLPVYCGGIGIIKAKSNASSAYIFSKLSCVKLEVFLLPDTLPLPPHLVILTMLSSTGKLAATLMCSHHLPISETGPWLYSKILSSHSSAQNVMLRMLLANSQNESGAWLEALPVPSLGLHLSDNELRIIVSLRHGVPTCTECIYICNEKVGILGTHGLK